MDYMQAILAYRPQDAQEETDKAEILRHISQAANDILTRENESAHITSSGFILNETYTKTLMVYHNIYHSYAWTGGHADGDGDLLGVAVREAMEETGISLVCPLCKDILSLDVLPVPAHQKRGKSIPWHLHLSVTYGLIAPEEQPIQPKLDENSKVAWIPIGELATVCEEKEMLPIYEKIIRRMLHIAKSNRYSREDCRPSTELV